MNMNTLFTLSETPQELSPHVMFFAKRWWIYDLSPFHEFWRQLMGSKKEFHSASTIWEALLKAYGLHAFSALEMLRPFAEDYHQHHKNNVSARSSQKVFQTLSHLGLQKLGHLRRLTAPQIQRRFGVAWGKFFYGILEPKTAPWIWIPHKKEEILQRDFEFDHPTVDALLIFSELSTALTQLAATHPFFGVQKLRVTFYLYEQPESPMGLDIAFTHRPFLKRDHAWIMKILQERLMHLQLDERAERMSLELTPARPPQGLQLSLFQNESEKMRWHHLIEKLEDQNFQVFQPQPTASYVPELSWKRESPLRITTTEVFQQGLQRPLIQENPCPIAKPEGRLHFMERLQWFDERGKSHCRDYFMTRSYRQWIWIFLDESKRWYRQGVIE